jgi:hypothetical protein
MARTTSARRLAVRLIGGLLVIAGVLTSCTYTEHEPGLSRAFDGPNDRRPDPDRHGPGLRAGDAVPPDVRLGLTSDEFDPSIFLVDGYGEQVYRPLDANPASQGAAVRPTAPRRSHP